MDNELYHGPNGGSTRKTHKYIKREWKNGRWVYYYDEDAYPIGQNYKTAEQIDEIRALNDESIRQMKDRNKRKQERIDKTFETLDKYVTKGQEFLKKLDKLMHTRVIDLPITIDLIRRGEFF